MSGRTSTEPCGGKDFTPGGLRHTAHRLESPNFFSYLLGRELWGGWTGMAPSFYSITGRLSSVRHVAESGFDSGPTR